MVKVYTAEQVTEAIREDIARAGGEQEWCDIHDVKRVNVNRTVHGKIRPGGKIAEAVGYKRILLEAFVKIEDEEKYTPPAGLTLLPYNTTGGTGGGRPPSDTVKRLVRELAKEMHHSEKKA